MEKKFEKVCAKQGNIKWEQMKSRLHPLYQREGETRTEFDRDYSRIIFSNSYRRLKSKTQVFYSPTDDHICTRIEHVNNVECVSYNIANVLGLNTELTKAISVAHDLGHSPFGHAGERTLNEIAKRELGETFWHEKNGLYLVDSIELLEDVEGNKQNLNLTYAVRDGIVSHCGEIDENALKPRDEFIDLDTYSKPNEFAPFTWEACVVKIADKISYLGRDIEDALSIGILKEEQLEELKPYFKNSVQRVNNTIIINELINDLCTNSTPKKGLLFSKEAFTLINKLKQFNYENIYKNKRLLLSEKHFCSVLNEIYDCLVVAYDGENTMKNLEKLQEAYPSVVERYIEWLENYILLDNREELKLNNKVIYDITDKKQYVKSIITYISGMTDHYAVKNFQNIISF